jgi:hypothetical protein
MHASRQRTPSLVAGTRCLVAFGLIALSLTPVRGAITTITFDTLAIGTRVTNQYESQGVVFSAGASSSRIVDADPPGTMSGTRALEVEYGGDIPDHPGPMRFRFTSLQKRVRVHVGLLYVGFAADTEAVLRVFNSKGALLERRYVTLGGGPRAVRLPLEIDVKTNQIAAAEVQFLRQDMLDDVYWEVDTRATEVIDNLIFEGADPPPPPADDPPVVRITSPTNGQIFFGSAEIPFAGTITEAVGLGRVTLQQTYLDEDPDPPAWPIEWGGTAPNFTFPRFPAVTRARLHLGRNRLTFEAEDSRGQRHSQSVEVTLAPAPVVTITSPADESTTSETTVTVRGRVVKPYGALRRDQVACSVNGGAALAVSSISGDAARGYTFTATAALDDARASTRNAIRVVATDEGGATGSAVVDVIVSRPSRLSAAGLDVTQATLGSTLVAGRRTVARLYSANGAALSDVRAVMHGFRGDAELAGSPLSPFGPDELDLAAGESLAAKRDDQRKSWNFVLPASWTGVGTITLVGAIDPDNELEECDSCQDNNIIEQDARFQLGEELRIQPIRVSYREGAMRRAPSNADIAASLAAIIRTFPYAEITILPTVDHTTNRDLTDGIREDRQAILGEIYDRFTCYDGDVDDFGDIFGWLGDAIGGCEWSTYHIGFLANTSGGTCPGGLAYVGSPACVAEASPWVAAHELAHCIGFEHAGNAHGEADGGGFDERFPYPHGTTGVVGFDTTAMVAIPIDGPYPPGAPDLRDPCRQCDVVADACSTHDFLSYGDDPNWISDYTHRNIFRAGFTGEVGIFGAGAAGGGGGVSTYQQIVHITGSIDARGQATLRHFYIAESGKGFQVPPGTGALEARAFDAGGKMLVSHSFEPHRAVGYEAGPQGELISGVLPFVPGTARIDVLHDGVLVESRKVSASAPRVTLLAPNGGEALAAEAVITVRWQSSDADGGELRHGLQYSNDDGATWINVAFDIAATELEVSLADLPGGDRCRFRVMATDGVLSARDLSNGPFSVGAKAPVPTILYPRPGTVISPDDAIVLEGSASDLEEGALETGLVWRSSRDGVLGKGRRLDVDGLSAGTHRLRLEATDRSGETGVAEIEIVVGDAPQATSFLRGNSNGEDAVDIADAISTLAFLFSGGKAPRCADAADANDDGRLDLSDALYTLGFLFLGGPAPPVPFPQPGLDPTADGLGCNQ